MNNIFGREQKLKGKKTISEIFNGPKNSVNSFPFRAFYLISKSDKAIAKFGISVPKKKFRRAVDRNRIKRLVKESIRLNNSELNQLLRNKRFTIKVMIVCNSKEMPNYSLVNTKIKEIINRLSSVVNVYEEN